MTEEERATPELFLDDSAGEAVPRIKRVAQTADMDPETVRRFLAYFLTTRTSSAMLAAGQKPPTNEEQFQKDMEKVPQVSKSTASNRQQRRAEKKKAKSNAGKTR